jgi:hypothetical protein
MGTHAPWWTGTSSALTSLRRSTAGSPIPRSRSRSGRHATRTCARSRPRSGRSPRGSPQRSQATGWATSRRPSAVGIARVKVASSDPASGRRTCGDILDRWHQGGARSARARCGRSGIGRGEACPTFHSRRTRSRGFSRPVRALLSCVRTAPASSPAGEIWRSLPRASGTHHTRRASRVIVAPAIVRVEIDRLVSGPEDCRARGSWNSRLIRMAAAAVGR